MRYPKNLPAGGTIGFVAPSMGCNIDPYKSAFENAQKKFSELGYKLQLGPNCYAGEGVGISNTPEKCAKELMAYYGSPKNDCLISCGGGELMCEVLSYIDFERVREAEPKWYMGYSDNTNFTYLLATLCDTASVYGPCAAAFGMEPWHPALSDAMGLLTGQTGCVRGYDKWEKESLKSEENPLEPYHVTEERVLKVYDGHSLREAETAETFDDRGADSGKNEQGRSFGRARNAGNGKNDPRVIMEGRLLGGCMDCLVNLLGTRFDRTVDFVKKYRDDGIIWFLEACDLNVFGIRRAMWQMEEAGWFQYVKGFLIGRPLCYGQEMMGLDAYQAVLEVAGRKNVPVVMDVDIGHLPPMMPVMVGSVGQVRVKGNEIRIRYLQE